MKEYYFLLSSVTSAMKGEEILRKNGLRAYVFRDAGINPYGCGYIIKATGEKERILDVLRRNGVRVNEVREGKT